MTDLLTAAERLLLVSSLTNAITGAADLRASLARVGWQECLEGAPVTTVSTVARRQGSTLTAGSMLVEVAAAAAGLTGRVDGLVLPRLSHSGPPGRVIAVGVEIDGVIDTTQPARRLLVPAIGPEGVQLLSVVCRREAGQPHGIDLARAVVPLRETLAIGETVGDAAAWDRVRAASLRFLAVELCGVTEAMLGLAVAHTTSRVQFGRPLAAFQAVKHKLADVRTWLECANLACEAAFEDDDVVSAALAKTLAVRASRTARENCQQVMGGMGFSWEHDLHRYVRRALLLEPLVGSATTLRGDIGSQLHAAGQLPALATL